jgi:hypothetical protein
MANLAAAIDRLGMIKAQIAGLKREYNDIHNVLTTCGPGTYEGDLFCATVSVGERETLDLDAVRDKLSPQFIAAHTNRTEITTVRVTALGDRR